MRPFLTAQLVCMFMPAPRCTLAAIAFGTQWAGRGARQALDPNPTKYDPRKTEPLVKPPQPPTGPIPTDVPVPEPTDVPVPDPADNPPPTPTDPYVPPQPRPIP
jgi:hypothetical protein